MKEIIAQRQDGIEIAHANYEYDAVDNLKKKYFTDDFEGEYFEEYIYDVFNRLTFAHSIGLYGDKEYRYQPNNNISLKDERAYDYTSSRPHAVTNDGRYSYSYDANGNMVSRSDGTNIVYNYENRVSNISGGNIYTYDDSGSRIKKTEGAATTYYFFGNYEETVEAGNTKVVTYYFTNGQRIAQRTTNGTESTVVYYHTDHLGSAVRLTDDTGNIVQSIAYDPFGKTVFASGAGDTKYQFTDQEFDGGTGFYYYGARYYDPELGRFLQADTILAGLNRYVYCGNNPINFTDPTGHYGEYSNPGSAPGSYDDGTTHYSNGVSSNTSSGTMSGNDSAFPKDPKDGTIVKYGENAYMYRGGWKRLVPAFNGGITGLLVALTDEEKEMIYGNGNNTVVTETGNVDETDEDEGQVTENNGDSGSSTGENNGNSDSRLITGRGGVEEPTANNRKLPIEWNTVETFISNNGTIQNCVWVGSGVAEIIGYDNNYLFKNIWDLYPDLQNDYANDPDLVYIGNAQGHPESSQLAQDYANDGWFVIAVTDQHIAIILPGQIERNSGPRAGAGGMGNSPAYVISTVHAHFNWGNANERLIGQPDYYIYTKQ